MCSEEQESDRPPVSNTESVCQCGALKESPSLPEDKHVSTEAAKSPNLPDGKQKMGVNASPPLNQTCSSDSLNDSAMTSKSLRQIASEDIEAAKLKTLNFSQGESTQTAMMRSSSDMLDIKTLNAEVGSPDTISNETVENIKEPSANIEEDEKLAAEKSKKKTTFGDEVSDNVRATLRPCPSLGSNISNYEACENSSSRVNGSPMMEEAWERLKKSYVYYKGNPVGTLAAMDPSAETLNYNQVFTN